MNAEEIFIPIVLFLSTAAVLGLMLLTRHKERMSMIERGLKAEDIKSLYERGTLTVNPLSALKWGIVFVCVGLAIVLAMMAHDRMWFGEGIYPALIALFGGIGLIIFYIIASKKISQ